MNPLSRESETALIQKWRDTQDRKALDRLIGSHQKLLMKVAQGYKGYGLPMSDIIAEGNVGMMQALKNYDIDRGFRFSTYAVWWVKSAITDFIIKSASIVRIARTAAQKKLFFKLLRSKREIENDEREHISEDTADLIARKLNVPKAEVLTMHGRLKKDFSLNSPITDGSNTDWVDWIEDTDQNFETQYLQKTEHLQQKSILDKALQTLNTREHDVLVKRRLTEPPLSLEEIAKLYHVSKERIRQVEISAFDKVRTSATKSLS